MPITLDSLKTRHQDIINQIGVDALFDELYNKLVKHYEKTQPKISCELFEQVLSTLHSQEISLTNNQFEVGQQNIGPLCLSNMQFFDKIHSATFSQKINTSQNSQSTSRSLTPVSSSNSLTLPSPVKLLTSLYSSVISLVNYKKNAPIGLLDVVVKPMENLRKEYTLPTTSEDLNQLKSKLVPEDYDSILQVYFRDKNHAALRYLMHPNFWASPNQSPLEGNALEQHKLQVVLFYLTIKHNKNLSDDEVLSYIVRKFSYLCRAGNKNTEPLEGDQSSFCPIYFLDTCFSEDPTCLSEFSEVAPPPNTPKNNNDLLLPVTTEVSSGFLSSVGAILQRLSPPLNREKRNDSSESVEDFISIENSSRYTFISINLPHKNKITDHGRIYIGRGKENSYLFCQTSLAAISLLEAQQFINRGWPEQYVNHLFSTENFNEALKPFRSDIVVLLREQGHLSLCDENQKSFDQEYFAQVSLDDESLSVALHQLSNASDFDDNRVYPFSM